ncbi:hypothetical protein V8F20_008877 [Naviculisporaceae sp. PSN 640]
MVSAMSWGTSTNSTSTASATDGSRNHFIAQESERNGGSGNSELLHHLRAHLEGALVFSAATPSLTINQTFQEEIGTGGFFNVYQKEIEIDGATKLVAVKRLNPRVLHCASVVGSAAIRTVLREVLVMETMKGSPFIVTLLENSYWSDGDFRSEPYTVVELATDGTLADFLEITQLAMTDDLYARVRSRYAKHSYVLRKSLLADILTGLLALHVNNIFHTDLKPDNILIFKDHDAKYHAKLSDFGSSIMRMPSVKDNGVLYGRDSGGTEGYKAPELADLSPEDVLRLSDSQLRKVDLFSIGPIMTEVVSSCSVSGYPLSRNYSPDSIRKLDFIRDLTGDIEWDTTILPVIDRCSASQLTRCDNVSEILSLFGHQLIDPSTLAIPLDSKGALISKTACVFEAISNTLSELLAGINETGISSFLKENPIAVIEGAGLLTRYFHSGLSGMRPLPELLLDGMESEENASGSPEHQLLCCIFSMFSNRNIDFEKCVRQLRKVAKLDFVPAQVLGQRLLPAFLSILDVEKSSGRQEPTWQDSADDQRGDRVDDRDLEEYLRVIEKTYPENFIAHAIRVCERRDCARQICLTLRDLRGFDPGHDESTWGIVRHGPLRDEHIQTYVQRNTRELRKLLGSPIPLEDYDLLLAAAIVFGDEQSSELRAICDVLGDFHVSLDFTIQSFWKEHLLSPLMLACLCGIPSAVKILLHSAGVQSTEQMTRLKSSSGQLPLHFLFTFPDEHIDDMCFILSRHVSPEDTHSETYIPAGYFCTLLGTPLDMSLKVGSVFATRALWREIYSKDPAFSATIQITPTSLSDLNIRPAIEISEPSIVFAIRCWCSMQPAIWDFFLSILEDDHKIKLTSLFQNSAVGVVQESYGLVCFCQAYFTMYASQTTHMTLHGPQYMTALVRQLEEGIRFFLQPGEQSLAIMRLLRLATVDLPDPHLHVAMVLACQKFTSGNAHWQIPGIDSLEAMKWVIFYLLTEGLVQGFGYGHSIGFVMSKMQPPNHILVALAATALNGDLPAFQRIVQKSVQYEINLVDHGVSQFLLARFAKRWPPEAEIYLQMVSDMPALPSALHWSYRLVPSRLDSLGDEYRYTESGRLVWDAMKHHNLGLLLFLIDKDPSLLCQGIWYPGIFSHICVSDQYHTLLQGLLEHLGPERSLLSLRSRTRFSGLSAIDIAIYYRSTQCLLRIARFLVGTGGYTMQDLFPGQSSGAENTFGPLMETLLDLSCGEKFLMGADILVARWIKRVPRDWNFSDVGSHFDAVYHHKKMVLITFVLEMSRHDRPREEVIEYIIKEYLDGFYDRVLAAEEHNQDDRPVFEDPGRLVDVVRFVSACGILSRRVGWKIPLFVTAGVSVFASVSLVRLVVRRFLRWWT